MVLRETGEGLAERKLMIAAFVAIATTVAGITYVNENEPDSAQLAALAQEERILLAKRQKKGEACGKLQFEKDELKRRYFNRRAILDRLMVLGQCTKPDAIEFNFRDVCTQIEKGIRDTKSDLRRPVLHPFYVMLYQELNCKENMNIDNASQEIQNLFRALSDSDIIKRYRLLDDKRKINEVCNEALAFAADSKQDIADIQSYVLSKHTSGMLEKSPYLKDLVEAAKETYQKNHDGRTPTPQDLEAVLQSILGYIATAAAHPFFACFNPEAAIATYNLGAKTPISIEKITEKRRLALPVLRELLELIRTDTEKTAADKVGNAILRMAFRMNSKLRK